MITVLLLDGTFHSVGYAEEPALALHSHQSGKPVFPHESILNPSFSPVVCSLKQKTDCQSKPLSIEKVELEELFYESTSSSSLVRTSFIQTEKNHPEKGFLNIEIYVDQQHRNFQDEILEIFDQSLVLQTWQGGVPIFLECYCDDRESLAYSFILGHIWGKRTQGYLENLAIETPWIEVSNYGKTYRRCQNNFGECQDVGRLRSAFRFLAIGQSHSGCLIRLKLPSNMNHRRMVLKEHPLFLQKIHVAGVSANFSGR